MISGISFYSSFPGATAFNFNLLLPLLHWPSFALKIATIEAFGMDGTVVRHIKPEVLQTRGSDKRAQELAHDFYNSRTNYRGNWHGSHWNQRSLGWAARVSFLGLVGEKLIVSHPGLPNFPVGVCFQISIEPSQTYGSFENVGTLS